MPGVLAAVFILTAALAAQTFRTARNQRRVVATSLQRFASQAAWTIAARAEARLYVGMSRVFRAVDPSGTTLPLDDGPREVRRAIVGARDCNCLVLPPVRAFAIDVASGRLVADGPVPWVDAGLIDRLAGPIAARVATRIEGALIDVGAGTNRVFAAVSIRRRADGRPARIYGYEVDPAAVRDSVFGPIVNQTDLLPIDAIRSADAPFSVSVRDSLGRAVYEQGDAPGAGGLPVATGPYAASLRISVGFTAAAAALLLPGAASTTSSGLLAGTVGAVGVLLLAAGLMLRRSAELARARASFTSSVSHELKTPLTQILLFAETMMHGRLGDLPAYRREAGAIVEEARHLLALIDNVLHASRFGDAAEPLPRTRVRLGAALEPVVASFAARAGARGVEFHAVADGTTAWADPDAVRVVVRNLLDNALKYGAREPIHLTVRTAGSQAEIAVEDGGPGVPETARQRIFEPFVRLPDASAAVGGSGVGLSVVRNLVTRQGGEVGVGRGGRGGARFIVHLPLAAGQEQQGEAS